MNHGKVAQRPETRVGGIEDQIEGDERSGEGYGKATKDGPDQLEAPAPLCLGTREWDLGNNGRPNIGVEGEGDLLVLKVMRRKESPQSREEAESDGGKSEIRVGHAELGDGKE